MTSVAMKGPDFGELQGGLGRGSADGGASEAHGSLCGLLCAGAADLPEAWIRDTLADAGDYHFGGNDDARTALEALHAGTVEALDGGALDFQLLLPDDAAPLAERAAALASWCNAFLYGLSVRGLRPMQELPDELREILADFSEIGRAGVAEEETQEEGESAYVELVEYVRVAVQIVYEECRAPPAGYHGDPH